MSRTTMNSKKSLVDFSNTEIAFSSKTNGELKKMAWLFRMMNQKWLVDVGSQLGLVAVRWHLPFAATIVKKTIFEQFVGGTTLLECQPTINKLYTSNIQSILDYGAEAKSSEQDFNYTMNETIRAIEFGATNASVPVVSCKITGLARFELLERIQNKESLDKEAEIEYQNVLKRLDAICYSASEKGVAVFFDAEESWIQDTIDDLVNMMMKRYNKGNVFVYNTFQMYRHDRLAFLKQSFEKAKKEDYLLGAKLVRGAYMDKERARAAEKNYPSPIQADKAATDRDYNAAVVFCVEHYEKIASANATHNMESCLLQANLIAQRNLPKDHPHLNFCQLYGMSDQISFNLANAGYNVAKYVPYGSVREVVPYLVRRAQENSSVTGDMGRELGMVMTEMKRRKLA